MPDQGCGVQCGNKRKLITDNPCFPGLFLATHKYFLEKCLSNVSETQVFVSLNIRILMSIIDNISRDKISFHRRKCCSKKY